MYDLDLGNVKEALNFAVEKHLNEANMAKEQSQIYWWRILESIMFSIGNINWVLLKKHPTWCNSIRNLLNQWTSLLGSNIPMILQARITWLGGRFSTQLTPDSFIKHIEAIIANLSHSHHILRISAVRYSLNIFF